MKWTRAVALLIVATLAACGPSAVFRAQPGETYSRVLPAAVLLAEADAHLVIATGGRVIGVITTPDGKTDDERFETASKVAARYGGTHIVQTAEPVELYTKAYHCPTVENSTECAPPVAPSTPPPARYLVLRMPPQDWHDLPVELRPKHLE